MIKEESIFPGWVKGSFFTLIGAALAFWGAWCVARADVDNLKRDVSELKPLAQAVAAINAEIPNMKEDIKFIKTSQQASALGVRIAEIDVPDAVPSCPLPSN